MNHRLAILVALLASAFALLFSGCEAVNVGVAYQGKYGTYTVMRRTTQGVTDWNVLVSSDGKRIVPLHP